MTDLLTELEALAKELDPSTYHIPNAYEEGCHDGREEAAEKIRALIASEKARGPDPLLVQAREELQKLVDLVDSAREDGILIHVRDKSRETLAALDAKLGGKT